MKADIKTAAWMKIKPSSLNAKIEVEEIHTIAIKGTMEAIILVQEGEDLLHHNTVVVHILEALQVDPLVNHNDHHNLWINIANTNVPPSFVKSETSLDIRLSIVEIDTTMPIKMKKYHKP